MLGSHLFSDLAPHVAVNSIFHLQTHEEIGVTLTGRSYSGIVAPTDFWYRWGAGRHATGTILGAAPESGRYQQGWPPRDSGTRGHTYFLPVAFDRIVHLPTFSSTMIVTSSAGPALHKHGP